MGDPGGGREQGGRGTPHQHHALLAHHQSQAMHTLMSSPPLLITFPRRTSSPPSSPPSPPASLSHLEQPWLSSLGLLLCRQDWATTPLTTSPCRQDIRHAFICEMVVTICLPPLGSTLTFPLWLPTPSSARACLAFSPSAQPSPSPPRLPAPPPSSQPARWSQGRPGTSRLPTSPSASQPSPWHISRRSPPIRSSRKSTSCHQPPSVWCESASSPRHLLRFTSTIHRIPT